MDTNPKAKRFPKSQAGLPAGSSDSCPMFFLTLREISEKLLRAKLRPSERRSSEPVSDTIWHGVPPWSGRDPPASLSHAASSALDPEHRKEMGILRPCGSERGCTKRNWSPVQVRHLPWLYVSARRKVLWVSHWVAHPPPKRTLDFYRTWVTMTTVTQPAPTGTDHCTSGSLRAP